MLACFIVATPTLGESVAWTVTLISIFRTLQRNLCSVDFSQVLLDVVIIADEVDSQLKQALSSFVSPKTVLKPLMVGREEHSFSTNTRYVSDLAE